MVLSRLFWKLFLITAGLNLVGAIVVGIFVSQWLPDGFDRSGELLQWMWGLIAIECSLVCLVSYNLIARLIRPVKTLMGAAEALAAGDYGHSIYMPRKDEFGQLAGTLNRMSHAMQSRMTQLSQTAARQATVLGGMIEGVVAVDAHQRVVLANDAAGRLFNFHPVAVDGRRLLEVIRNHALYEAVTAALATSEARRFEFRRTGQPAMIVDVHVQPLPGQPCPGVVLVIHDTTALRRLEAIRREFVANVSHELKTPLSSIKAYTETLRNGALRDPEVSERFLQRIEEQSERLNRLIIDMLMLARVESDQQTFELVGIDVVEAIKKCLQDHLNAADAKHITMLTAVNGETEDRESPCCVRADREALREILGNLLDNAIKYTPEGGSVTVCWRNEERYEGTKDAASGDERDLSGSVLQSAVVRIDVCDTGIGIKAEDQERIFERFYRVDKARLRELGGTGLGLSIVKHLAQSMGGKVAVESEIGRGSTFTIELPQG